MSYSLDKQSKLAIFNVMDFQKIITPIIINIETLDWKKGLCASVSWSLHLY